MRLIWADVSLTHPSFKRLALDLSEKGGMTLEDVGHIMNLTRERVRQVEVAGLEKLRETGIIDDINKIFGTNRKFEG